MSLFDKFTELNYEIDLGMKYEVKVYFTEGEEYKKYKSYSLEINNNIFYIKVKLDEFIIPYIGELINDFVSYIGYSYLNAYKVLEYDDKVIVEYLTAMDDNTGAKFILEYL